MEYTHFLCYFSQLVEFHDGLKKSSNQSDLISFVYLTCIMVASKQRDEQINSFVPFSTFERWFDSNQFRFFISYFFPRQFFLVKQFLLIQLIKQVFYMFNHVQQINIMILPYYNVHHVQPMLYKNRLVILPLKKQRAYQLTFLFRHNTMWMCESNIFLWCQSRWWFIALYTMYFRICCMWMNFQSFDEREFRIF